MSFIGPRPLLPVDQPEKAGLRLLVRPGLTGWAQVNGGKSVTKEDKAILDLWYLYNASIWLDVKIIFKTVHMIIFGERLNKAAIKNAYHDLGMKKVNECNVDLSLHEIESSVVPLNNRKIA